MSTTQVDVLVATQDDRLTSKAVLAAADITYRQLDHWCRTGVLVPDEGPRGSGTSRTFSTNEARLAQALGHLSLLGLDHQPLLMASGQIRVLLQNEERPGWLVVGLTEGNRRHGRSLRATVQTHFVPQGNAVFPSGCAWIARVSGADA